jgi:hypothetical protein
MNKPIIIFYEPFEIIVKENDEIISYLDELKITESELLEKYDIDYKSFFTKDIRDKYGKPEKFESNDDINKFLLDYINI